MPETRRVLIADLTFNEHAEAVEEALKKWLNNPANMQYFDEESSIHWSVAIVAISIDGDDKYGHTIKMVGHNGIIFSGTIDSFERR